jgi:LmbE family N-acetylglucosaminyl deacetylase
MHTPTRLPSTYQESLPEVDVLAISARPGCAERSCAGTLMQLTRLGLRTAVLDLSAGEIHADGEDLMSQAGEAARAMGLHWRGSLCLPDARLENSLPARMTLAGEIRRLKPRLVVLPHWDSRDPDERAACALAEEAIHAAGLAKLDESSEPHRVRQVLFVLGSETSGGRVAVETGGIAEAVAAIYGAAAPAVERFDSRGPVSVAASALV